MEPSIGLAWIVVLGASLAIVASALFRVRRPLAGSVFAAPLLGAITFYLVGTSFGDCPRFGSYPVGGCTAEIEPILTSLMIWSAAWLAALVVGFVVVRRRARRIA